MFVSTYFYCIIITISCHGSIKYILHQEADTSEPSWSMLYFWFNQDTSQSRRKSGSADQLKSKEISTKTFADSCLLYKEGKPKVTSLPWE